MVAKNNNDPRDDGDEYRSHELRFVVIKWVKSLVCFTGCTEVAKPTQYIWSEDGWRFAYYQTKQPSSSSKIKIAHQELSRWQMAWLLVEGRLSELHCCKSPLTTKHIAFVSKKLKRNMRDDVAEKADKVINYQSHVQHCSHINTLHKGH